MKSKLTITWINHLFAALLFTVGSLSMGSEQAHAGDFTVSSSTATSATGTVTDSGQTGSFSFTRNSATGYAGVLFTDGASGLQAANQEASASNDSFNYTFVVTPPLGYEAVITVLQAPYAGVGNSEAADRTLTWGGGGLATISDPSSATRADQPAADFPPYSAINALCPDLSLQNQIAGFATGDPLSSGTSFVSYSVDNANAAWSIALPQGVSSVDINNVTRQAISLPGLTVTPGCDPNEGIRNNTPFESFQEWIAVDVAFVFVGPEANDESGGPVNGATGGNAVPNVLANDTLDGVLNPPIGVGGVTLDIDTPATPVNPGDPVPELNTATGAVDVPAGTPAGTYTIVYEICDEAEPTSCDTATVTVTVDGSPIVANDDTVTDLVDAGTAQTGVVDIFADNGSGVDTLNGVATDETAVDVSVAPGSSLPAGFTLNANGTVDIAAGTAPGAYSFDYQICETLNPTNCATAEVELVIVDTGTGLINEIEEDLTAILEEDLANTVLQQSDQISSYSADALDRLRNRGGGDQCMAATNLEARNILFDVDKATIKPSSHETLDKIAAILSGCPGTYFEIAGHTDSDASDAYNLDLSQRRVRAVLWALTERGMDTSGYLARGYGESQPIASNATEAGKAQNRRVEFRPLPEEDFQGNCDHSFSLVRNLDIDANGQGTTANGRFNRDSHNCVTDRRDIFSGTLSYLDTDQGQRQSAINLSYRREQYRGSDSVFGYFVGLYGTESDVSGSAEGDIQGFGINAGVYGAKRLQSDLFLDYYLGAAAGKHKFHLNFDRDIGTINATGDYTYFAGFAGAALSGELEFGKTTVTPRVGIDYMMTSGADVDVVASLSGLSEVGGLELDAISGGRIFAELRTDRLINDGNANLWLNPRIACYQSLGSLDGACGFGGSIGMESTDKLRGLTYAFELDGEWGDDYSRGALSLSIARELGIGAIGADAGINSDGTATMNTNFEMKF